MSEALSRRQFLHQCARCTAAVAAINAVGPAAVLAADAAPELQKGYIGRKLSPYFTALEAGAVRCELCPNRCQVDPGERGLCEVRENSKGRYYSLVYGNPCAVHVDPIEKKPFFHVLPGTRSFSLATAGCNFDCKFCQNWEISQARPEQTYNYALDPARVVGYARRYRCPSIASTYVEPTIFFEYMYDIARLARPRGILKVMHSNGFINEKPLRDLGAFLGAACIDLKGFTESYYQQMTEGSLQPVLNTLTRLKRMRIHTEIVNLVIPGKNDDPREIRLMCQWIADRLGADTPLHFSRFYPRYKLKSLPPTPVKTLERAHDTAVRAGLRYVYIGNVPHHPFENTYCPKCGATVIRRLGYQVDLAGFASGRCARCGQALPGIWRRP